MSGFEAAIPYLVATAAVASTASSVMNMTASKPKPSAQQATPKGPSTTPFETNTTRNASETESDILRKEQARKAGGVSGGESILTGGLGVLGNAQTQSGSSNLLGL
jgi:hypothetical protein